MSIYRRSGRYAVRIDLEPTALGGRRRKNVGTYRTRKQAEAAERKALDAKERGEDLDPRRVTLAEVAERFLRSVAPELSPATTARYEEHWRMHVAPTLGAIPVARLKKAHLTDLYAKLRTEPIVYHQRSRAKFSNGEMRERTGKPLGRNTTLRVHRFIHHLLEFALDEELVTRNVAHFKRGRAPKAAPSPARAFNAEQVAAILDASEDSRHHSFFVVLAYTALRRGEAGALRWDAINFDRSVATVRQAIGEDRRGGRFLKTPKSGRTREVPLDAAALDALRRQRSCQATEKLAAPQACYVDQGFVFADQLGNMLDLDAVSKSFSVIAAKAGIKGKGYSLHSLRHFGATEALVKGSDYRSVAALLGHASPSTTLNVYGHVVPGAQERAVASIGGAITAAQARRKTAQK